MTMQRQWKKPSDVLKKRKPKVTSTAVTSEQHASQPPPCKKLRRAAAAAAPDDGAPLPSAAVPLPADWSVKKQARFTSSTSFSWAALGSSAEEASATASFLKGSGGPDRSSPSSDLQGQLMLWVYPGLPFLQTIDTSVERLQLDATMLIAVQEEWNSSFRSLFHMFKGGHCSHFYLCATNLSVLFHRTSEKTSALVCPSSAGLRQALRQNGVQFSTPVSAEGSPDQEDVSSASSWLQSIGIHSDNPVKIASPAQSTSSADKRKLSEVVVEVDGQQHLHGLFNFLLNSKSIVFSTGAMAGLPPTLLSPTAFLGAALTMLKVPFPFVSNFSDFGRKPWTIVKHGVLNECLGSKMVTKFYLDVTGPLLPQALAEMLKIVESKQDGEYTARLAPVLTTTALNFDPTRTATLKTIACDNHTCNWS